jgi:two-component sensor histidine kinase
MEVHHKPKPWHGWLRSAAITRRMQRIVRWQPSPIETFSGAVAFAALPAGAGVILGFGFGYWACFAVYFPAILLAALWLDWRGGLLTAVLSAIASNILLSRSPMPMGLTREGFVAAGEYWASAAVIIATAALLRRTIAQVNAAADREHSLNLELRHRVNNSLALALAFASQTKRSNPEPEAFYADFQSRLMALARAQDVLTSADWADCQFPTLAETALEAFVQRNGISLSGGRCCVPPASCVPLVLALHELATNAVKHGALSVPQGRVSLSWTIKGAGERSELTLHWMETGGPPVERPVRRGLGSRLLVRQSGLDEVNLEFCPAGVQCTIVVRGATRAASKPQLAADVWQG